MKQQFLVSGSTVIVAIISAIIVMIIHEFTKAIGYLCYIKIYNKKYSKNIVCPGIFRLHRYIDPIGLIFAVTNYSAFSKPYPYMIKSPKASLLIGLSGYLSMGLLFVIAIICHNSILPIVEMNEYVMFILHGLSEFIAYFCVLVFLANLFPIVSFDMALIVAALSPINYVKLYKFDMFYKLAFIIITLPRFFTMIGLSITIHFLID